ncbi:hypothetical protein F0562_006566 [Nyssa sinensis]|uniref:Uncharacterized protein n=1 Tax=Nyssa sinensis TaxID=561372 RepID=A0A5J5AQS7_9ASTE|nr:hypothetical protein F0562_006566 [Nyssa sinensis]
MAHTQTIYTRAFFLALVACNGILFTEARQLKSMQQEYNSIADEKEMGKKHGKQAINSNQNPVEHTNGLRALGADHIPSGDYSAAGKKEILPLITANERLGFDNSDVVYKDDFRPTTPGNKPGVGHPGHTNDIQTKGIGPDDGHSVAGDSDDIQRTSPGHSPGVGHSVAGDSDDIQRTSPGHSPGVGHSKEDFRPTTPGDSPGVVHPGHTNDFQTKATGIGPGDSHSVAGDTDDIRRTNPGHSPGVGHSKEDFRPTMPGDSPGVVHPELTNDIQTKAIGIGPGDSHSVAGDTDSIRHTNPGHSPGIGHSKDDFRPTTLGNNPGVGLPGHKNDIQTKAIGIGPGDSHSVAGDTDDIRHTNPGHSPGVGHSFQTTNAETNA